MAEEKKQGAQAPASPKQGKESKSKYIVAEPFADKDKFSKRYEVGDDVSHFEPERLESAIKRGLVKKG